MRWTADLVMERIIEAAHALATQSGDGPRESLTAWPDVVQDRATAYGYTPNRSPRLRASAAAVSRMDETLGWLSTHLSASACRAARLAPDAGAIVWWRAAGRSWGAIALARATRWKAERRRPPGGNSEPRMLLTMRKALAHVSVRLEAAGVPVTGVELSARSLKTSAAPPTAMPRQMARMVTQARPCGDCARYGGQEGQNQGLCALHQQTVLRGLHAEAPAGAPCFQARAG